MESSLKMHNTGMSLRTVSFAAAADLACCLNASVAEESEISRPLDGQAFEGRYKVASGFYRFISVKLTIIFSDEHFHWLTGPEEGYHPVSYTTTRGNGTLQFTARLARKEGDSVEWSGNWEGKTLTNVSAVWTRLEKDFVHDLFLSSAVKFVFIPQHAHPYYESPSKQQADP